MRTTTPGSNSHPGHRATARTDGVRLIGWQGAIPSRSCRASVVLALAVAALLLAPQALAYPGAPGFRPGVPYDQNFPDPHVLRVGGAYYAYATVTGGAYLPVMSSTDLRVWTPRPSYDSGAPLNGDPFLNDALPYPARWAPDRPVEGRLK